MALAPRSSSRRLDVLQQRIEELQGQQRHLKSRRALYQAVPQLSALERTMAIKADPIQNRFQGSVFASSGSEHRAALLEQIAALPPTSSGIINKPFEVKIGIISDLFLYKSFEGLADFRLITPDNYAQHADVDLLLLVSTWRGIDGSSWKGVASPNNSKREILFERLLPFFRTLDIPIVFYSKEDPPNYDLFLPFAQEADIIFTSAAEMVTEYEKDCPRAVSIDVLPFGINPKHHSPVGSQQGRINRIVPFAGSWFNHKYNERSRWGGEILDAVVASDDYELVIFDRNSELNLPNYRYPNRFAASVSPAIEHQTLLDIQRQVDFGINLNSVSDSASMFANRAIELQAQGTVVLSNYNLGLNSRYPHVHISNGFSDTLAALNTFDDNTIRDIQAEGIRSVFSNDLAVMRIASILKKVGLSVETLDPQVVVVKHNSDQKLDDDIASQTYKHTPMVVPDERLEARPEIVEGADIVVHFDSAYEYGPTYVQDLVNAFRYTDAVSVEKTVLGQPSQTDHRRHSYITPQNVSTLGAEFVGQASELVIAQPGYVIDEVGVRQRRESIPISQTGVQNARSSVLSVVVPIYNNGAHLLHKCIASLRRSSIFDEMEIILVDDGSTSIETLHALESLERELEDVQVYRFEPGGSGSASRPRNKGLELASCDYITYLDPDNEAIKDGYVKLLNAVLKYGVDFAVGNMTRWRGSHRPVKYTNILRGRLGFTGNIGWGGPQALQQTRFMPVSIQAIVARTQWLRDTGISQPVGAVGQDSYFYQQILYYSESFATVDVPVHTYYAEVENSVVNSVNANFFKKYLPLERARSQWLSEVGLLDDYKRTRFEEFFTGWYLRKLRDVPQSQWDEALSAIAEIALMYGKREWMTEEMQRFEQQLVHETVHESKHEGD